MLTITEMIQEFQAHPLLEQPKGFNKANLEFRLKLIDEEWDELGCAYSTPPRNYKELVKEAVDLLYVTSGLLVSLGVNVEEAFAEVHKSNMSKFNGATFREDGKLNKGPDYVEPDMGRFVR